MSAEVEAIITSLDAMDLGQLRCFWQSRYGKPPALRSEQIMRLLLAWRLQVHAFGGLDAATLNALGRTGPVLTEGKHLGIGARLTRQWKGRSVTIIVEEDGFRWGDQLFPSLFCRGHCHSRLALERPAFLWPS